MKSSLYQTDYTLSIGDIPSGSTITLLFQLQNADSVFYSNNVEFSVGSVSQNVPVSPSEYGYWAYDDTDTDFDLSPTFEWIELDPSYGGSGANEYLLDDDDHVTIQLPLGGYETLARFRFNERSCRLVLRLNGKRGWYWKLPISFKRLKK